MVGKSTDAVGIWWGTVASRPRTAMVAQALVAVRLASLAPVLVLGPFLWAEAAVAL